MGICFEISSETETKLKNYFKNTYDANQSEQFVEKKMTFINALDYQKSPIVSSEEILVDSLDTEPLNSSYDDENFSGIIVNTALGTKHSCNVCLLSFTLNVKLEEHVQKHTVGKQHPSILKKT